MPDGKRSSIVETFLTFWIVIRVGLILVVWIALFLALFLGYFTIPIIVVIVLTGLYAISDAVFVVASRMREQAQIQRDKVLQESTFGKKKDENQSQL